MNTTTFPSKPVRPSGNPLVRALGGLAIDYAHRVGRQISLRRAGLTTAQASIGAMLEVDVFKEMVYKEAIPAEQLALAEERTLALVREQTAKRVEDLQGKVARWLSGRPMLTGLAEKEGMLGRAAGFLTKKMKPTASRALLGTAIGTALILPFLPGAVTPSERPEELDALYSGRRQVPVRKGQFWEFGRSPWEGERIQYFAPHWTVRARARAEEKSLWGENPPPAWEQWYKENFTYELEKEHYYDRPYPDNGAGI